MRRGGGSPAARPIEPKVNSVAISSVVLARSRRARWKAGAAACGCATATPSRATASPCLSGRRLNRVISCPLDVPPADWAGRLGC